MSAFPNGVPFMALSKNPMAYLDIMAVLDTVLASPGKPAVFRARNARGAFAPGAAVNWIQRAHRFRRILQEQDAALRAPGQFGQSKYDDLTFTRECGCRPGRCTAVSAAVCTGHIVHISQESPGRGELEIGGETVPVTRTSTPQIEVSKDLADAIRARKDLGLADD